MFTRRGTSGIQLQIIFFFVIYEDSGRIPMTMGYHCRLQTITPASQVGSFRIPPQSSQGFHHLGWSRDFLEYRKAYIRSAYI